MTGMFTFERARLAEEPYRHFYCEDFVDQQLHDDLAGWFDAGAPWKHKSIEDFLDLYELNLDDCDLPTDLERIRSPDTKEKLRRGMEATFDIPFEERVNVQAHRLIEGQRIRVHSDFGEQPQTHRMVIQFGRGWDASWGGLLLLLKDWPNGELSPQDRYYPPIPRLAVGFEISPRSYHAVSVVRGGLRYSVVYSFYCEGGYARMSRARA